MILKIQRKLKIFIPTLHPQAISVINLLMRFLGIILMVAGLACSPCKKLAEKICDCRQSQSDRTMCKKNLDLAAQHKSFQDAEDQTRCQEILNSPDCTCEAILSNQLEKCGLTRL